MGKHLIVLLAAALLLAVAAPAAAATYHGVEFPGGLASFADEVVSYQPGLVNGYPAYPDNVPAEALGAPDFEEGPGTDYVSLGDGGTLTLRFTDNSLTGSGTSAYDLWIFEIGPDVEDTFVWVSTNGLNWHAVGKVTGGTRGIDLDAYGFGPNDHFSYIQMQDDTNEGDQSGVTVGADIDAVGAISTAPPVQPTPLPGGLLLLGSGLAGLAGLRRRG